MATIKVRVQGEIATNLTPEVKLVCQNDKYDVEFEFDESWSNSNFKTALFIYNGQLIAIPFDGTICKIPALYETELLHIGVKSDDVVGLHTTTPAKVVYLLSANDLTSNKIPEPSKDVYDEIIALLNKYISGGGSIDLSEYQKKVDENLPTTNKTIVGAIAEVKEIAETAKMVFGETEGTAYEGNKGKANADNIANLKNEVSVINIALEQSGLLKKYKQPIEQEYTDRVTADGANVLDGSKAVLKKVEGSTVACKQLFDIDSLVYTSDLVTNANGKLIFDNSALQAAKYIFTDSVTAIKLKPNTTYTSRCKFKATLVNSGGQSGGSMSRALRLQTNKDFDGNAIVIFGDALQYGVDTNLEGIIYSKFTTPADLSEYKYLVTRMRGYSIKEFSELMLVEGEYTESNFPEYQPYFTGLKSASFAGIESTNADGTETSTLAFPKTETPLGTTIDFENKKIVGYGYTIELKGTEEVYYYKAAGINGIRAPILPSFEKLANGVSSDFFVGKSFVEIGCICIGASEGSNNMYIIGVLESLGFTDTWADKSNPTSEEKATAVSNFKAWLAQRYADGNPVTIRYVSATLQSETPFTAAQEAARNTYTAYTGGTETVLGNDNAEFGANNTVTQDYILVTEVK